MKNQRGRVPDVAHSKRRVGSSEARDLSLKYLMAHWHLIRLCIHCQSSTRAPSKYYSCFSTKTERRLLSTTTLPEDLISLTPVLLSDHVHGPIWLKSSVKGNFLRIMCRKLVRLKHIFWIYDELGAYKTIHSCFRFP